MHERILLLVELTTEVITLKNLSFSNMAEGGEHACSSPVYPIPSLCY